MKKSPQLWIQRMKKNDFYGLATEFGISPYHVRILCNRDINTREKIAFFLNGTLDNLYDPYEMKDMEKACEFLYEDIMNQKHIRIIGDYDVDGVTSTYILKRTLEALGAKPSYVIPHRIEDGYGLNEHLISQAIAEQVDTILTCDNGISAMNEILLAKTAGIRVIVTDHHDVPYSILEDGSRQENLPAADAVVDPKQMNCNYPYEGICGAVVAYKLSMALLKKAQKEGVVTSTIQRDVLEELLEFAALGTVCDVMELLDENHIIVKYGLRAMKHSKNVGLNSLISLCDIKGDLSSYHLGFIIGPCVNATGRLDSAKRAMELFSETNRQKAIEIASELKDLNDTRKALTIDGVEQAKAMIESGQYEDDRVLVVFLPDCHESLAGIIAGKIRESYNRPCFVVTKGQENLKGSGRSIEEYHMRDGLQQVEDLLLHFGGHKLAAGFSLKEDNLEEFRRRLNENCTLTEDDLKRKIYFDIALPINYATLPFVEEISILEPFGTGNRAPIFAQKNMHFYDIKVLGKNNNVVKVMLEDADGHQGSGIYFGDTEEFMQQLSTYDNYADVIYSPKVNEFRGYRSVQLEIVSIRKPR